MRPLLDVVQVTGADVSVSLQEEEQCSMDGVKFTLETEASALHERWHP